jgi:hypothetical protein
MLCDWSSGPSRVTEGRCQGFLVSSMIDPLSFMRRAETSNRPAIGTYEFFELERQFGKPAFPKPVPAIFQSHNYRRCVRQIVQTSL